MNSKYMIHKKTVSQCISVDYCKGYNDAIEDMQKNEQTDVSECKWEIFEHLSSVHHGRTVYFKQSNGLIYSRISLEYMTFAEAVDEFAKTIEWSGYNE